MKNITYQLKSLKSLVSSEPPYEDIETRHYPETIVCLQQQTTNTDAKEKKFNENLQGKYVRDVETVPIL